MEELQRIAWIRTSASSGHAKRLRLGAHVSIAELAKACGVAESTIWRWENGQRAPRGPAALRYAAVLEVLRAASGDVEASWRFDERVGAQ